MVCTFYSHQIGFGKITGILQQVFPKGGLSVTNTDGSEVAEIVIKGGLFRKAKKVTLSYRQRLEPGYMFPEVDDSPLTSNLRGLYGFVNSIPASNETIKDLFLRKIETFNSECTLKEEGNPSELKHLIKTLAREMDAVVFAQPDTIISQSGGQHFLDRNLDLLLDTQGNCYVDNLEVVIDAAYYDKKPTELTEEQLWRKKYIEDLIAEMNVGINKNLPAIESEEETTIREPQEIARRICVLAITIEVAFSNMTAEEGIAMLQQYKLWDDTTPDEKDFLANVTEKKQIRQSWKSEGMWVLMWALGKVDDLGIANEPCDMSVVGEDNYPIGEDKDPNDFIDSISATRSKAEILNASDLYYRLDWACVDARINNKPIPQLHPGVVYERHYALNWLINYMDQDWDDITCDT